MRKSIYILLIIFVLLLIGVGFVIYQAIKPRPPVQKPQVIMQNASIPEADKSIILTVVRSKTEDNSVDISVQGLQNVVGLEYEFSYDTQGQIQGVNNGNKPIDVTGKNTFERTIYLGTQSSGKKTPHKGVNEIQVTMRFTDNSGNKTQKSQTFSLK